MQTPKSRSGTSEISQKISPGSHRIVQQLKVTPGNDLDSPSSGHSVVRVPSERSPKCVERKSPKSPIPERKRSNRVTELESQLSKLRDDLKKTKEQMSASELGRVQAQQEACEAKKKLAALTTELEQSRRQLCDLSASEDARLQELCKISHERDRVWESELEALQKQHSVDSAALSSSMNDIQRLRRQLDAAADSEAAQARRAEAAYAELQAWKKEQMEALSLVEDLKVQLGDTKNSEAQALKQLEEVKASMETLREDGMKADRACKSVAAEFDVFSTQVSSFENTVARLNCEQAKASSMKTSGHEDDKIADLVGEPMWLAENLTSVKRESEQLTAALETAEVRYQEEHIRSMMEVEAAYELVEKIKSEARRKESDLEAQLNKANEHISVLRVKRSEAVELEMEKIIAEMAEMRASLTDKETELQSIMEENKLLKLEAEKLYLVKQEGNAGAEATAATATAQSAEQEVLTSVGNKREEVNESWRRDAEFSDQLEAARTAKSEMEVELRRLRIQSDQWRKAAEAAAAVLAGNNGKLMGRSASMDYVEYNHPVGRNLMDSPYMEEDGSPKKKNSTMLRKIGVLWKKGRSSTSNDI